VQTGIQGIHIPSHAIPRRSDEDYALRLIPHKSWWLIRILDLLQIAYWRNATIALGVRFGVGSNEHHENLIPFASSVSLKLKGTPPSDTSKATGKKMTVANHQVTILSEQKS
jgi:hypothetical protein